MSGSDEAKRRARIDREERAKGREQAQARREAAAAARAEAKRAEELRLLDEVKAAKVAGAMPSIAKAKVRPKLKPGMAAVLGERTVDDPMQPGQKLKATVNLAEHPLEMMLARRRLTQAQYEAGIRFRAIYEHAMIGPGRGIDPGKIKVDGGKLGDPLSDAVLHAHGELKRILPRLGKCGGAIAAKVCGQGATVADLAPSWPGPEAERSKRDFIMLRLKEALDVLAEEVWGAVGPAHGRIAGLRDLGTGEVDMKAVDTANQIYLRRRGLAI